MYVTELIKYKAYREFLIKRFPIPEVNINAVSRAANMNPSLTGNAFEIYFRLINTKKNKLEQQFQFEYKQAEKNISSIYRKAGPGVTLLGKDCGYVELSEAAYQNKIPIVKKILSATSCLAKGQYHGVRSITITKDLFFHINLFADIKRATDLIVYPYNQQDIIIYDVESLAKYYLGVLERFKVQATTFFQDKRLTKSFVKTILSFSHISHPFFSASAPLKNLKFETAYLSFVFKHFNSFCKNFQRIKGKLIEKPSLACFRLLATPDFLLKDKILEVKTSQKFSKRDYLQALSYLIFAQYPENKMTYGKINSAVIYYSLVNQQVEINLKDLKITQFDLDTIEAIIKQFKKDFLDIKFGMKHRQ